MTTYQDCPKSVVKRLLSRVPDESKPTFAETIMATSTRNPRPNSFNAQVADLQTGESVSKIRAIDPTTPVQRLPEELPSVRQQVRNACAPAVTRAKEQTGADYTVEVGDVVMPAGNFYVVAVVTRVS